MTDRTNQRRLQHVGQRPESTRLPGCCITDIHELKSNRGEIMRILVSIIAIPVLVLNMAVAQSSKQDRGRSNDRASKSNLQPAATDPVTGRGTSGRISKWTGVFGSNTFTLGDSNI